MKNQTSYKKEMVCKLTSQELQHRKETVLAELRNTMVEKVELPNGFSYRFDGSDNQLQILTEFVITERRCCDFFDFAIRISENESWLEVTGPEGVKDFIIGELAL